MKSRVLMWITATTLLAALAVPVWLAAQGQKKEQPQQYTVTDLGTLGGTFGEANAVNNKGWVVGDANLPGDTAKHAFLSRKGLTKDLNTLGGPNSIAFSLNESGKITGFSDTSTPDPLGEDFCGFGAHLICLPFLWQHGMMTPLPTLGGNNGFANDVNNRGQVVGSAENTTRDPTCPSPPAPPFFSVLENANSINSQGQIAGKTAGVPPPTAAAFLATPCDEENADIKGCQDDPEGTSAARADTSQRPAVVLPENVRKLLQHRSRFGPIRRTSPQ